VSQTVQPQSLRVPTTTKLTAKPRPGTFGRPVTFTATVKTCSHGGGTPSGSLTFFDGTPILGTEPLRRGKAILKTASLDFGSNLIEAEYTPSPGLTVKDVSRPSTRHGVSA
jgi:hypothetical protein